MNVTDLVPLLEITRGGIVESLHLGSVAVVDSTGRLLFSAGNPESVNFLRSSAKPFQTLPFVEKGGVERFRFTEQELALTCASHSGTDVHMQVIKSMQQKIGIQESDLSCGTHPPYDEPTQEELILRNEKPTPNRHNCSGKHTGMLAQAQMGAFPLEGYIESGHPVQQAILEAFAACCEIPPEKVIIGIDGCSVPTFAVPLYNAALGFARLCDPIKVEKKRGEALQRICRAMMEYPEMVAGPGRFDTAMMQSLPGKILCKGGAEGFQAFCLMPGVIREGSPGVGVVYKIADGDQGGHIRPTHPGVASDSRARPIVALSILRQLGVLTHESNPDLAAFDTRPIRNWRKVVVGELRPAFQLSPNEHTLH